MSVAVDVLSPMVPSRFVRGSVKNRVAALSDLVDEVSLIVPAYDEFVELLRVDPEVADRINAPVARVRLYAFFCRVAVSHSVVEARGLLVSLLLGLTSTYASVETVRKLGLSRSELQHCVGEIEFFIPALLSCGAVYFRP